MAKNFPKLIRALLPPTNDVTHPNEGIPGVASIPVIEYTFLQMLSKHLGFKTELLVPQDGAFGFQEKDGNWSGIIGMLQRKEADLSISYLMITEHRQQAVDFSFPYTVQDQTFVTSKPASEAQMATFIFPFSNSLWLCILAVYFVISLVFYLLDSKNSSLLDVLTVVFGSACKQPFKTANTCIFYKILFICWWFFVTLMTLSYSSVLLSYLTIPLEVRGIETIEELSKAVDSGSYKALTPRGSSMLQQLTVSDQLDMKRLGQKILENEWYYDVRESISNYFEDNTVLIGPRMRFCGAIFEDRQVSSDTFGTWNVGIALRKNFCCKKILDKVVLNSISGGLYQNLIEKEILRSEIAYYSKIVFKENSISISWKNVRGIFILWLIGEILSFVCLLIEVMWHCLFQKKGKIWWIKYIFKKRSCK